MKKLVFIMPLMAISLLASCNNGGGGGGDPEQKEWYEDTTYINSLTTDDVTKENPDGSIGVVQTIKVNGLDHKVRLIGVDQDVDSKGNKIHTTWEFVNLISDENGYALATLWNDANDVDTFNHNYLDSSLRMALVKEKPDGGVGHILWAQKGETKWSNQPDGPYTNKSVLEMLPDDLTKEGILKVPSKYINIWNKDKKPDAGWEEQIVNDKLFLLSPREMGLDEEYQEPSSFTYTYYNGHTGEEDAIRIKKQINGTEVLIMSSVIPPGSGQTYTGEVYNYAGNNWKADETSGGALHLRSPLTNSSYGNMAWYVKSNGGISESNAQTNARAVAPAFCI